MDQMIDPSTIERTSIERAGELLQIEGVPAAFVVELSRVCCFHRVTEELEGLGGGECRQLCSVERPGPGSACERACQPLRNLPGACRQCDEHRLRGRPVKQRSEELHRGRVCPVHVVEDQRERAGLRE